MGSESSPTALALSVKISVPMNSTNSNLVLLFVGSTVNVISPELESILKLVISNRHCPLTTGKILIAPRKS